MAQRLVVSSGGKDHTASITRRGGGIDIELDGLMHRVRLIPEGPPAVYLLTVTGTRHEVAVERTDRQLHVLVNGRRYGLGVWREGQHRRPSIAAAANENRSVREGEDGAWTLLCPMTGLIRTIEVQEGATVEPNALLIVIEAMKMNNEMRAQRGATVRKIHVLPGDRIEQGADLVTFGPSG